MDTWKDLIKNIILMKNCLKNVFTMKKENQKVISKEYDVEGNLLKEVTYKNGVEI